MVGARRLSKYDNKQDTRLAPGYVLLSKFKKQKNRTNFYQKIVLFGFHRKFLRSQKVLNLSSKMLFEEMLQFDSDFTAN